MMEKQVSVDTKEVDERQKGRGYRSWKVGYLIILLVFAALMTILSIPIEGAPGYLDFKIYELVHDWARTPGGNWLLVFSQLVNNESEGEGTEFGGIGGLIIIAVAGIVIILLIILGYVQRKKARDSSVQEEIPPLAKTYKFAWTLLLTIALSYGIMLLLKVLIARPRPSDIAPTLADFHAWWEGGAAIRFNASFPSGHVIGGSFGLFIGLCLLGANRKILGIGITIGGFLYSFIIGLSRLATRDHYITDIIAGFFIGISIFVLLYFVLIDIPSQERIERRKRVEGIIAEARQLLIQAREVHPSDPAAAAGLVNQARERLEIIHDLVSNMNGDPASRDDLKQPARTLLQFTKLHEMYSGSTSGTLVLKKAWLYIF